MLKTVGIIEETISAGKYMTTILKRIRLLVNKMFLNKKKKV